MRVFTTGQVAKICKVASRTVNKWFDSGRLRGYRIPGSRDRRIPWEFLIKFLKEHGMPLGDLEDEDKGKVIVVSKDSDWILSFLPCLPNFIAATAENSFEAGILAEGFHPDCIIVDFAMGHAQALRLCQNLRGNSAHADTIVIALLPDDDSSLSFDQNSINETFKKPFDAALLAERLRTLIGARKELI